MSHIQAVLFDMDGTLVDSEALTEIAVADLLTERGMDISDLDLVQFHGVTWQRVSMAIRQLFPEIGLSPEEIADQIEDRFQVLFNTQPPPMIPGAHDAFVAAHAACPGRATIVTGSEPRAVELLLDRENLHDVCTGFTAYGHYQRSKPDPQCYRMAADRLDVDPADCFVFEDSRPGMEAARAAGMRCYAITRGDETRMRQAQDLADGQIADFTELPEGFFTAG